MIPERGHLFLAIDPGAFSDPAQSRQRIRRHLDEIKRSRKAHGIEEILIPGERSFRARERSLASGIDILESVWKNTLVIARDLGVTPPSRLA